MAESYIRINPIFSNIHIDDNKVMLNQILSTSDLIEQATQARIELDFHRINEVKSIFWYGLGASALVGEYIRAMLINALGKNINFIVHRSYFNRASLDSDLIVVYTYSGNTYESIKVIEKLISKGAKNKLIIFSSGGKAQEIARKESLFFVPLINGYVSRSHLPYGVTITSRVISQILGFNKLCDFGRFREYLSRIINNKKLIQELWSFAEIIVKEKKVPIIMADIALRPLGYRFMAQLNENAKHHAMYFEVPEGAHNFVVGLRDLRKQIALFIVRRNSEDPLIRHYMDILMRLLSDVDPIFKIFVEDKTLSWMTYLQPTLLIDLFSVFLAELKGYRAFDIKEIVKIKDFLWG